MTTLDASAAAGRRADPWHATVLDSIGETPLIRVDEVWVKLEFFNPSGSIKARIAKYMIEKAEIEGLLNPRPLRRRRLHRGVLQPPTAALHPRLPHPTRSVHRPPNRSIRCMINN